MDLLLLAVAYVAGLLVVAPLGGVAASMLLLPVFLKFPGTPFFWQGVSSFTGALLAYYLLSMLFNWCGAHFYWFSYLLCMLGVIFNDGARAQSGESPAYATGNAFGIIAALMLHFFAQS
jgi:hypothetical protein